jgi:radical SAM superfamily enzyme YgiQ (UPF0313 family)
MSRKIKKIALISPRKKIKDQNPRLHKMFERNKNSLKLWYAPSLNLLVIAALTPQDIEITLFDEYYEDIDFDQQFDLVGITAMTIQAQRAYEIADIYRAKNIPVVMGGVHATVMPDEALLHADIVFKGEAERTWPQFLQDFENGEAKQIYEDDKQFDLSKSVVPRYELLNYEKFHKVEEFYKFMPVQATRGCPHDCSFCVVSKLLGKKIRKKPVHLVVEDIKRMQSLNYNSVLIFTDDNLFFDRKYAIELLNALIPLKIKYFAQTDIQMANDSEFLELVYKSGCVMVGIGFESVDPHSLESLNKNNWKQKQLQNYEKSIAAIQSHGILVWGAFVIGFNNDTPCTFDSIKNFVVKNKILGQFTLLTPLPGSRIYEEMKSEGRLLRETFWDNSSFWDMTIRHDNIPKELAEQKLEWIHEEAYSEENVQIRHRHMMEIYKKLPPRWAN